MQRLLFVVLGLAAAAVVAGVAWRGVLDHYAGAWTHAPEDAPWLLPAPARKLMDEAFDDAGSRAVVDYRVAVFSQGQLSGADSVNDSRYRADRKGSGAPLAWVGARLREHAAGIRHEDRADAEYLSRLLRQVRAMPKPYRLHLLARDAVYAVNGRRDMTQTLDYIDNHYVTWVSGQAAKMVVPVVSVHPYRPDAAAALERWAKAGVKTVSWLPIAQHIDLDDSRIHDCYQVMAKQGLTLQLPIGYRQADNGAQGWIDPDAVRDALDAGVDVVVTIAGTAAGTSGDRRLMPKLFALLRDPAYREHLWVDLAGVLAPDRLDDVLAPLLQHPQFYDRLRYASGYPTPAMASAIDVEALAQRGFIEADQVQPLQALYDVNPLLFFFVTLRHVHLPGTTLRLPANVFFRKLSS